MSQSESHSGTHTPSPADICPWNQSVSLCAAKSDRLQALQWLRAPDGSPPCPWSWAQCETLGSEKVRLWLQTLDVTQRENPRVHEGAEGGAQLAHAMHEVSMESTHVTELE